MKKIIIVIVVLVLIGGGFAWCHWSHRPITPATQAPQVISVKTQKVVKATIPLQVHAVGQILALKTIMLRAKQPGQIAAIYVKSGQWVKKGQLLLQINDTSEKANLALQEATYNNLHSDYRRYILLIKRAPNSVSADLLSQKLSALKVAKAHVTAAKKQLLDTRVIAPFSGRISSLESVANITTIAGQQLSHTTQIAVGAYLQVGAPIAVLSDTKDVIVQYQVPQDYSQDLHLGQKVLVQTSAYPKHTFHGTVHYLSPTILSDTQAYIVRAVIENPKAKLKSGMNAMVTQTLRADRKILAVPGISLVPSLTGYDVYMVDNSKVKAVPVQVGQRYNTLVAITSGIQAGDEIIVSGIEKVHPGASVKVVKE